MIPSTFLSILFLSIIQHFGVVHPADILFYDGIGSHSTRISKWPLMEALAEKGHSVTYLSAFQDFEQDPNKKSKVKIYNPEKWSNSMGSWEEHASFYDNRKNNLVPSLMNDLMDLGILSCEMLYSDPEFVNWVKSVKFDLVIVEVWMNDCAYGMVDFWKAKLAMYGTATALPWFTDSFGHPDESSSISDMMIGFNSGLEMTFAERFTNALNSVILTLKREYQYLPTMEEITRKGLGDEIANNIPRFKEIEKKSSLMLLTTHYSMDYPRSFPPNVVPVGGVVVTSKIKPLPQDMEAFVNSSKNGFIFISFGTVCEFTNFAEPVQVEFINALAQFPEMNFVWKSSFKINATTLPKNVFEAKWAPQQTLLGHPKIKAFITHAGMGSTMEAFHFSVPCVAIPVLADQDVNADMIIRKGAGIKVEIVDMKQAQLEHAIREILYNKQYRQAMNTVTKAFKDRPKPPLENAVWWVEYLLRHDNVNDFIVPPNVHQPWWKRRQLDVWFTVSFGIIAIASTVLYLLSLIVKNTVSFLIGGGKVESKTKVKRN